MYKLKIGEYSNNLLLGILTPEKDYVSKIITLYSKHPEMIINQIINCELDDHIYNELTIALTCSDDFGDNSLDYKTALLYYFILIVNLRYYSTGQDFKITSLIQGSKLYSAAYDDMNKLPDLIKSTKPGFVRFNAAHSLLWMEKNIKWDIPYVEQESNGNTIYYLGSGDAYAYIGEIESKIPYTLWIKFFQKSIESGKIEESNPDELQTYMDQTDNNLVYEVLDKLDLKLRYEVPENDGCTYYYDDRVFDGLCVKLLSRNASFADDETKDLWVNVGYNSYRLLETVKKYVPTRSINKKFSIYMI